MGWKQSRIAQHVHWPGRLLAGLSALSTAMALMLVLGSTQTPGWQLICTLGVAVWGCALMVWLWREPRFASTPLLAVVGLAALVRIVAVLGQPLLEDDYFRYLWDGYQSVTTGQPYRLAPAAFFAEPGLSAAWQEVLSGINFPEIPTIYGPLLQGLFALAYVIAPAKLGAIQGLLLVLDLGLLLVLARVGVPARWLLAYAVHPLVLKEAMGSAHPDGLVGLFLVLALLAWRNGHAYRLGLAMGLAVATKVSALVVLPIILLMPADKLARGLHAFSFTLQLKWIARVSLSMCLCVLLVYFPFVWNGGSELFALRQFGSDWRFNPLLFRLVEAWLPNAWARPLAACTVVATAVGLALRMRLRQRSTGLPLQAPPVDVALMVLPLLSPVVNPWYWLWTLAPAVLLGNATVLGIAACGMVSYLISDHFRMVGAVSSSDWWLAPWVPWACAVLQLGVIALVGAVSGRSRSNTGPQMGG